MTTHKTLARVLTALRETALWHGSPRLRAGCALQRANVRGAEFLGYVACDPTFRFPSGKFVSIDVVACRVILHVGQPPRITPP